MKTPTPVINRSVVTMDGCRPGEEILGRAAAVLAAGGLVVAPTETRYGLLARADSEAALEKMFAVKQRSGSMPIAVFCESLEQCWEYGRRNEAAAALAEKFLPGPLTLILATVKNWNRFVTRDGRIGLRYSPSPVINGLLKKAGFPVSATSANISGSGGADSVDQIQNMFGPEIDLYLDGGILAGDPSTVVDCAQNSVRILRRGSISENEILNVIAAASNE